MYLGDFAAGSAVDFKWNTTAVGVGSITRATNGTIRIYKNESATQRSSSAGITDTEDFDSLTGLHHCTIDLSNNTDSGFYAAGNDYQVVVQGMVVDGETFNVVIAHLSIENRVRTTAQAVWEYGTRVLTAGTNIVLAKGTGVTGFNDLDAAGVRGAVGLATANLDTQLGDIPTNSEFNARTLASADYATATALGTVAGYIDTEITTLQTSVDDLPTNAEFEARTLPSADYALASDLSTVDGNVDAIKAKTDSLTFTVPGQVDANIEYVNGTEVAGNGQPGTEWGPA